LLRYFRFAFVTGHSPAISQQSLPVAGLPPRTLAGAASELGTDLFGLDASILVPNCPKLALNEVHMTGTRRLPAGEPRKASQRHSRSAAHSQARFTRVWAPGDQVRWRERIGVFSRDIGDGEHAEIKIADRTYRVRIGELA
jgi:hypothetical protein